MVAQLLRLRLDLLAGEFRGGLRRAVLIAFGGVVCVVATVVFAVQLGGLRTLPPEAIRGIIVPVGGLVAFGFTVVPAFAGRSDQLDPRRYALFGIERDPLTVGLGVAAAIGVPGLCTVVLAVGQTVAWASGGIVWLAVLAGLIGIATFLLVGRIARTVGVWLFPADRARDAAWPVAVIVLLVAAALWLFSSAGSAASAGMRLRGIADVVGWTPWGAAWAAPADFATGRVWSGAAKLLISLVVVGVLAAGWRALVGTLLVSAGRGGAPVRRSALGWFDRLGSTPTGAVAARSLTYWGRDPRYRTSYLILVAVPLLVIPLGIAGVPWHWTALVPLPIMAIIAGLLPHNDVAYDNTAVWLHVASGSPGWSDRFGRITPLLGAGVPVLVAGSVFSALLFGDWNALPALIGVTLCALFSGLGLSSVVSAVLPYPTVRPGDPPFRQPQASGIRPVLVQAALVVCMLICITPSVWFGVAASGNSSFLALVVGVVIGAAVLAAGIIVGGRQFDRRGPDLLAAAQRN